MYALYYCTQVFFLMTNLSGTNKVARLSMNVGNQSANHVPRRGTVR